jgi:hypothetical protein
MLDRVGLGLLLTRNSPGHPLTRSAFSERVLLCATTARLVVDARENGSRGRSLSDTHHDARDEFIYAFRPRMIGSGLVFRLGEHSLEYHAGFNGQTPYPMIKRVRLGYRPTNFGARRFMAEIWPRNSAKIEIASASYKSIAAMEDQGPAYRVFIAELHRRIAASGGDCRFEAGFAAWRWYPMVAISAAAAAALVYLAVSTFANGEFAAGVLVVVFIGLFAWQMGPLILRNRPQRYNPAHIPEQVLP